MTPAERDAALRLLLFHAQADIRAKVSQGKLSGLATWTASDMFRGLIVTKGRIPQPSWLALTGLPYLPVVSGSSWLAKAILRMEHERDHRKDVGALLAAARRQVWILSKHAWSVDAGTKHH